MSNLPTRMEVINCAELSVSGWIHFLLWLEFGSIILTLFTSWQFWYNFTLFCIAASHCIGRINAVFLIVNSLFAMHIYHAVTANYTILLIGEKPIFSAPLLLLLLQITTLCNPEARPRPSPWVSASVPLGFMPPAAHIVWELGGGGSRLPWTEVRPTAET